MKKILVVGATGGMGRYLTRELLDMGYAVDGISLESAVSDHENLTYYRENWSDDAVMDKFLANGYDGIVDFLHYSAAKFETRMEKILKNTKHLIFLSSYRVYANEQVPVTETAPHLLEVLKGKDEEYLATNEYALEKSRTENLLKNSGYKNWTIVRPAIVISASHVKLCNLEVGPILNRAAEGKPTLLPIQAKHAHAGLIWAGDAGKLMAKLLLNEKAYGEAFTLGSAEVNTWENVVSYFEEIVGLIPIWIDKEDHLKIMAPNEDFMRISHRRGLEYDRMYDRILDNSKVLSVTGMKQSELMPVKKAFETELAFVPKGPVWDLQRDVCDRMEEYVVKHHLI